MKFKIFKIVCQARNFRLDFLFEFLLVFLLLFFSATKIRYPYVGIEYIMFVSFGHHL